MVSLRGGLRLGVKGSKVRVAEIVIVGIHRGMFQGRVEGQRLGLHNAFRVTGQWHFASLENHEEGEKARGTYSQIQGLPKLPCCLKTSPADVKRPA